jgi:hypothetical protein
VFTSSPTASAGLSSSPPGPKLAGGHGRPASGCRMATPSASLPNAPGGVPGVRLIATPPSVEPNPEAENLRRSAIAAPAARPTAQPAMIALEWNIGIDTYTVSPVPSPNRPASIRPGTAIFPWCT